MTATALDPAIEGTIHQLVVAVLAESGQTGEVANDQSLVSAGMTSLDMVKLLLRLEERFSITVSASAVTPRNFHSIDTIATLVRSLCTTDAPGLAPV